MVGLRKGEQALLLPRVLLGGDSQNKLQKRAPVSFPMISRGLGKGQIECLFRGEVLLLFGGG